METNSIGNVVGEAMAFFAPAEKDAPPPEPKTCPKCQAVSNVVTIEMKDGSMSKTVWEDEGGAVWNHDLCPSCHSLASDTAEAQLRRKKLANTIRDVRTQWPPMYRNAAWGDFSAAAQKAFKAYWENETKAMALFWGTPGNGKTRAAYAFANQELERGMIPLVKIVPDLISELRQAATNDKGTEAIVKECADHKHLLVLDDLGAEKASEFAIQELYRIIRKREEWQRKTIVTSNLEPQQIAKVFEQRLSSRITSGMALQFAGNDRRNPMSATSR